VDNASLNIWLDQATQKLQEELSPEQIILFGSWARGTATRRSDIDLFIVWDCNLPPLERIGRVLTLLSDAPYPVEAIVYTPQELINRCNRPFLKQLFAEGKILYERGEAQSGSQSLVPTSHR
jgi:predicted nucleotidyltransferase